MKIVYFGSDVFLSTFEYLSRHHEIMALYTYHHDEDYMTELGVNRRARIAGIPICYDAIGEDEIRRFFLEEGCELFFVAEYDRIIPIPEDLPSFRGVNVHSSLLPDGRSYYPVEAAMDRGLGRTGVTIHQLSPELDGGDIVAQRALEIRPEMDSVDVYLSLAVLVREMTEEIMADFDAAWRNAKPQTVRLPYWKRPDPSHVTLRHEMTRAEAEETFRRFNSLTQVRLGGRLHYVLALQPGLAPLHRPEWELRPVQWLYRVKDGHLRLFVNPKTGADRP